VSSSVYPVCGSAYPSVGQCSFPSSTGYVSGFSAPPKLPPFNLPMSSTYTPSPFHSTSSFQNTLPGSFYGSSYTPPFHSTGHTSPFSAYGGHHVVGSASRF
jgi:hypothetical protein